MTSLIWAPSELSASSGLPQNFLHCKPFLCCQHPLIRLFLPLVGEFLTAPRVVAARCSPPLAQCLIHSRGSTYVCWLINMSNILNHQENMIYIFKYVYIAYSITYIICDIYVIIHIMEFYSTIKKEEILLFETIWMGLEGIILSEMHQTYKHRYCMISLI